MGLEPPRPHENGHPPPSRGRYKWMAPNIKRETIYYSVIYFHFQMANIHRKRSWAEALAEIMARDSLSLSPDSESDDDSDDDENYANDKGSISFWERL